MVFREGGSARIVEGADTSYNLAQEAIIAGVSLAEAVRRAASAPEVDLAAALAEGRLLAPVAHPDPAHLHLTGTGLTHLGSAATRDAMHQGAAAETLTDSMKMFRMGLEGGKPAPGSPACSRNGSTRATAPRRSAPATALLSPAFALDAGEEPEIAGIYLIGPDGTPHRLGFALANEFSDHVTERQNYLFLAHSKLQARRLRPGDPGRPAARPYRGHVSRIRRDGQVLWEKPFLSGEANMSHTIANLEHHHFKYALFRQPGDVHVHMFGTATLSFADGIRPEPGDVFEIEAAALRPAAAPTRSSWKPTPRPSPPSAPSEPAFFLQTSASRAGVKGGEAGAAGGPSPLTPAQLAPPQWERRLMKQPLHQAPPKQLFFFPCDAQALHNAARRRARNGAPRGTPTRRPRRSLPATGPTPSPPRRAAGRRAGRAACA